MRILITGAAGFIGANLASQLSKDGHDLVLVDNFSDTVYPSQVKQLRVQKLGIADEIINLDIRDKVKTDFVFNKKKPEAIFHLAAHANVNDSKQQAIDYMETNVLGTQNVLSAAQKNNAQQIIFAGTSSSYDEANPPYQETSFLNPIAPYGASKIAAESLLTAWHAIHKIPTTVLRLFSVYGPLGRPDMAPEKFLQAILSGQPINIARNRSRDYVFVDDVVNAFVAALQNPKELEAYNIGSGQATSLETLAQELASAVQQQVMLNYFDAPAGDMESTWADISKAQQQLAWSPAVSLPDGCKKVAEEILARTVTN